MRRKKALFLVILFCVSVLPCSIAKEKPKEEAVYVEVAELLKQNEFTKALARVDGFLKEKPYDPKAQLLRAQVLVSKGDLEQAAHQAGDVLEAYPNPTTEGDKGIAVVAHQILGSVYVQKGDLEAVIREGEQALMLQPDSEVLLWQLAVTYAKVGKADQAREKANRLIAIGDKGASRGVMAGYAKELLSRINAPKSAVQQGK